MSSFLSSFLTILEAVAQIAIVMVAAGWLVRRKIVAPESVKSIASTVVAFFFPCLIFSNITGRLYPSEFPLWWIMPLCAIVMVSIGWPLSILINGRNKETARQMIPLGFFQNAALLVLPLGKAILAPQAFEDFALLVFLFILAHNPMIWSIGKYYMAGRSANEGFKLSQFFSAPLAANIIALLCVFTGLRHQLPDLVMDTTRLMGEATVPLATFVLGATLGTLRFRIAEYFRETTLVCLQKLFIAPALMLLAMQFIPWLASSDSLRLFFILQASSAPATSLILQTQSYGGDSERVGTVLLVSYALCLLTIPLWAGLAFWIHG